MIVDDVDDHGMPLDVRAEIDEFWAMPPPPPCNDEEFQKIIAVLPKNIDAANVRSRLERRWSVYLMGRSHLESLGLLRTKAWQEKAHLDFVKAARVFIKAYTEQIDNIWEMQTHEFEAPRKNRRQPLLKTSAPSPTGIRNLPTMSDPDERATGIFLKFILLKRSRSLGTILGDWGS